ncbi:putative RNase H-like nuclease (RuvC/YqgF family) [Pedobacter sp. UYP24]
MAEKNDLVNKGDRNKIYFLVIVIATLLGTNAYLFFKDKHESQRFVNVNIETDRLKLEVEKIEAELDKVNTINVTLSDKLITEQRLAREKIAGLKLALEKGTLTEKDLSDAQKQISELREFLQHYNEDLLRLRKENSHLKTEMDSLESFALTAKQEADALARRNEELSAKVKTGAALKASNVFLTAYKVKISGKSIEVSRASTAKKLTVTFEIVPNQLAFKDYHKIYLRIFNPSGNLIADENNIFEADGQEMQFTSSTSISFNDDNTSYKMDWVNPNEFVKGTYAVILYADGYTMGRASIELR